MIRFNIQKHGYVVEKIPGRGFTVRVRCPFRAFWVWKDLDAKTTKRALKLAPSAVVDLLRECAAVVNAEAIRLLDMREELLNKAASLEAKS